MAKEMITFKCGHTEERSFFGPYKERARKMQWLAGQLCSECYKAEKAAAFEAKKAAEAEMAEQVEAATSLPELVGSEKQIAWGRAIRAKAIAELDAVLRTAESNIGPDDPRMEIARAAVTRIKNQSDAKFWIETRNTPASQLVAAFIKETK